MNHINVRIDCLIDRSIICSEVWSFVLWSNHYFIDYPPEYQIKMATYPRAVLMFLFFVFSYFNSALLVCVHVWVGEMGTGGQNDFLLIYVMFQDGVFDIYLFLLPFLDIIADFFLIK